mmetsp:Transcript_7810/g.11785  ORF Transcript_7810/g.11785 Transcript_7810/m.11785 type:complete len:275 (-) Transcript_7810:138-962(-)
MASGNKNLRHLVGRKLVPFFVEDEKGAVTENVEKDLGMSASLDFMKDTESIEVRKWTKNGTFEDPVRFDGTPMRRPGKKRTRQSYSPNPEAKTNSVKQTNDRKKQTSERKRSSTSKTPKPSKPSTAVSSEKYAMPDFLVPPDPKDIPLPSFVIARLKAKGKHIPIEKKSSSGVDRAISAPPGSIPKPRSNSNRGRKRMTAAGTNSTTNSKDRNRHSREVILESQMPKSSSRRKRGSVEKLNEKKLNPQDLSELICLTEGGVPEEFRRQLRGEHA